MDSVFPSQIYAWLTALATAALLTPLVMFVMSRLGVVDRPDGQRKLHGDTVPLAGGLAIWLATLIAVGANRALATAGLPADDERFWSYFVISTGLLCAVGLADDIWHIRARHKLLGQMLAKVVLSLVLVPPLIYLFVGLGRRLDSGN